MNTEVLIFSDLEDEKIKSLILTMQIIRVSHDIPIIWKLTDDYLISVKIFLNKQTISELFYCTFFDTPIDSTTQHPRCVAKQKIWPLIK